MGITIKKFDKVPAGRIDVNDYITESGLDGLYVLEGHKDVESVKNMVTGEMETTGVYGIKDSAIKEVKQRAAEAGIKLPKELEKINSAKQLNKKNEKTARLMAGYYAWVNHTKMQQLTDGAFESYTPHQRDVLLSYLHNVDVSKMTTGNPGSLIDAIKLHNEDQVIRSIFMKADGTLADYEKMREQNKRGIANRWMAEMQWWYNPDAEVVSSMQKRDEIYKDIYNRKGHLSNLLSANKFLCDDTKRYKNENVMIDYPAYQQENSEYPIAEPKQAQETTFMERMANGVKAAYNAMWGSKTNEVAQNQENMLNSNQEV